MFVAGLPVRDELVLELARMLDDDPRSTKREDAYGRQVRVIALTIPERELILRALDDPPAGLEELRGVLLRDHVSRQREGLYRRRDAV